MAATHPDEAAVPHAPASQVLQQLHDSAPADGFTLAWLLDRLRDRSFAIIMLVLAVLAMAPGISTPAGLLLVILAGQMMLGLQAPAFPAWLARRRLPNRYLAPVLRGAVRALGSLEGLVRPRWPAVVAAARRPVAGAVALLGICVALFPIPFSNVVPAALIAFIALAWLEEDGALLTLGLLGAIAAITALAFAIDEAAMQAGWLVSLF